MPRSPEASATIEARRTLLTLLLGFPLSYDEIAIALDAHRHVVNNDVTVLRKENRMPERPLIMDYNAKLQLYRSALNGTIVRENVTPEIAKRIASALRSSLDINEAVKAVNLMLKGVAMARTPKLPKDLQRTAIIWRLAIQGYGWECGIDRNFWRRRMQPAPYAAAFTIVTFEKRLALLNARTKVFTATTADELAERFVAFLGFDAEPSNGSIMIPLDGLDVENTHASLVLSETTKTIIEKIISSHDSLNDTVVGMIAALVDDGESLEEIAKEFNMTRERVRTTLATAFRVIGTELRTALNLGATPKGIDATDTWRVMLFQRLKETQQHISEVEGLLSERTQMLIEAGLMPESSKPIDGAVMTTEEMFASLCRTVESFGESFSVRAHNCFQNAEMAFIWQVAEKTEEELRKSKKFGSKTINEIKEILSELGLSLGMKFPASVLARLPKS